jgi:putative membrane protein
MNFDWLSPAAWQADPVLLCATAALAAMYVRGSRALTGAGMPRERWRHLAFGAGVVFGLVAVASPLDTYATQLFWVHMVQHLLLLMVVPVLFVLAAPWLPLWHNLPHEDRTRIAAAWQRRSRDHPGVARVVAVVGSPAFAFTAYAAAMWLWHWPPFYDAALGNELLHEMGEHLSFLLTGTLFWLMVIESPPLRPALGQLGRLALVAGASVQNVVLAAILGFAPVVLYSPYAATVHPLSLPPLTDQQLGAGIMWTFGDVPFAIALTVLDARWLSDLMRADDLRTGVTRSAFGMTVDEGAEAGS